MASMQYDVFATQPLTSTGDFLNQNGLAVPRARIKTIYAVNGASAGSVVIRDGSSTGPILLTVNTSAVANAGYTIIKQNAHVRDADITGPCRSRCVDGQ